MATLALTTSTPVRATPPCAAERAARIATAMTWMTHAAHQRLVADRAHVAEAMLASPEHYCPMCDGALGEGRFCHDCREAV